MEKYFYAIALMQIAFNGLMILGLWLGSRDIKAMEKEILMLRKLTYFGDRE